MAEQKTILFYYHEQDNYVLSNFYPHIPGKKLKSLNIIYEGLSFPTSEHLYHALKFKWETKAELEWLEHIRTSSTPGISKHLGHQFTTKRYKWQQDATALVNKYKNVVRTAGDIKDNEFRPDIMRISLQAKFDTNKEFREALISTYPHKLCEDTDTDWGHQKGWLGTIMEEIRDKYIDLQAN